MYIKSRYSVPDTISRLLYIYIRPWSIHCYSSFSQYYAVLLCRRSIYHTSEIPDRQLTRSSSVLPASTKYESSSIFQKDVYLPSEDASPSPSPHQSLQHLLYLLSRRPAASSQMNGDLDRQSRSTHPHSAELLSFH